MKSRNLRYSAFSLAEMMVVMLIASIVLAAMAPVVTTKMKSDKSALSQSSPWKWDHNGAGPNTYFGNQGATHTALIGQVSPGADDTGKLIIRTEDDPPLFSHILFKRGNVIVGRLNIGTNSDTDPQEGTFSLSTAPVVGHDNTAFGRETLQSNTTGWADTAIGSLALSNNTTGSWNTAVGEGTLHANTTGYSNVAVGTDALRDNTEGHDNVGVGVKALYKNINAEGNVAVGTEALRNNTAGINNVAVGISALRDLGLDNPSGASLTTGETGCINCKQAEYNTAIGADALRNVHSGRGNTAVGVGACYYNTGSYNTCIGEESGPRYSTRVGGEADTEYRSDLVNKNGNTFISAGTDGKIYLRGNVVIDGTLTVSGSGAYGLTVNNGRTFLKKGLVVYDGGYIANGLTVRSGRTTLDDGLTVNNGGKITLSAEGRTNINGALLVHQRSLLMGGLSYKSSDDWGSKNDYWINVYTEDHNDPTNTAFADGDSGVQKWVNKQICPFLTDSVTACEEHVENGGNVWDYSDRRLKYVGQENKSGLDKIRQLKVFNYTFKKDPKKTPHVGIIAQDLQKIFPNAVTKGPDGFLSIRMEDMFYAVINAVKELDKKLTSIEKTLVQLQKDNKQLKQENAQLKARLDKIEAKLK